MAYVSDSGHWYDREGQPAYEVPNKSKGGMRPTRITDARKLDLVPSVTGILKVLDKPALMNWKIDRIIDAMLNNRQDDQLETTDQYIKRVKDIAFGPEATGADRGTEIHGAIELWYSGETEHPLVEKYRAWVDTVDSAVADRFGEPVWLPEKSFSSSIGYGGKVDLHSEGIVIDFKTKDFGKGLPKAYDEQVMQLMAYGVGLELHNPILANVFIDRTEPKVHIVEVPEEEKARAWKLFVHCLEIWKLTKGYDPSY